MPQIIDNFFAQLAGLLGPLSPFAKSISTAALPVIYAIVASFAEGKLDDVRLAIGISGLVLALVVYLIPNQPKPAPAPAVKP